MDLESTMKPMSPEEQELEEQRSRLSGHYRAGSTEEPPAHLDAAILAAARREVEPFTAEVPHPNRGVRDLGRPVRGRAPRGRPFLCHVLQLTIL